MFSVEEEHMTDCLLLLLWHWQWLSSLQAGALQWWKLDQAAEAGPFSLLREDSGYNLVIWGNFLKACHWFKEDVSHPGTLQWFLMAKTEKEPRDLQLPVCQTRAQKQLSALKWLSRTCSIFLQISGFPSSIFCVDANRLRQARLLGEVRLESISARRACQTGRRHGL